MAEFFQTTKIRANGTAPCSVCKKPTSTGFDVVALCFDTHGIPVANQCAAKYKSQWRKNYGLDRDSAYFMKDGEQWRYDIWCLQLNKQGELCIKAWNCREERLNDEHNEAPHHLFTALDMKEATQSLV